MMDNQVEIQEKKQPGPADHLANERTFLAWIRTSIALMGFGFVVVKFALFIRQIAIALGNKAAIPKRGHSATVGIVMVAFGAIIAALSYFRYLYIEKQLNKNAFFPSKWLTALLTVTIIIASMLLVYYLLPNIQ